MLLDDLNENQLKAVAHIDGPLLITAGAGSGKTKTLTNRLLNLLSSGIPGNQIVAITFTNKAAEEIKNRIATTIPKDLIENNYPFIGTFHAFGAKIMRKNAIFFNRSGSFTIFDENDSTKIIKQILKENGFDKTRYPFGSIRKKISRIKDELLFNIENEDIESIYNRYELTLERQNSFDFDDLIEKPVRVFQKKPEILSEYQNKLRYFLIDEYQDINTAEYQLIKLLSDKYKNLSVVGDDHQSIYSFRSADFRNFLNFEKDFPEAKIITLDQNYRSTQNIISAASALINHNKYQRPKKLWTKNKVGDLITVHGFANAEEEADSLAQNIIHNDDTAILYRTNAQSRQIEQSLIFNNIPYFIYGGLKFYDRKEIKDIVSTMKYAINSADELSKERIFKSFKKTKIRPIIDGIPHMASFMSPVEFIGYILKETDYFITIRNDKNFEERKENIGELISFANEFTSVAEIVERISLLETADKPRQIGTHKSPIKLMTIHMAKGLEFDNVFIAGVSEGILPHERSLFDEDSIEEERRLMYVAMTRAKNKLFISFFRNASRFLYEIPSELVVFNKNYYKDEDTIYLD